MNRWQNIRHDPPIKRRISYTNKYIKLKQIAPYLLDEILTPAENINIGKIAADVGRAVALQFWKAMNDVDWRTTAGVGGGPGL